MSDVYTTGEHLRLAVDCGDCGRPGVADWAAQRTDHDDTWCGFPPQPSSGRWVWLPDTDLLDPTAPVNPPELIASRNERNEAA